MEKKKAKKLTEEILTEEILNNILENKKEIANELETISLMEMNIGKDVKLVKLRSHLRKSLERAIKLTQKKTKKLMYDYYFKKFKKPVIIERKELNIKNLKKVKK